MNITLALFIYLCIYMNINYYITSEISADTSNEILERYDLKIGERILKINGQKIYNDEDVSRIVQGSKNDHFTFVVQDANGNESTKKIYIPQKEIGYAGIVFESTSVYQLIEGEAGATSGLLVGDVITSIDGNKVENVNDCIKIIKRSPNQVLNLRVNRNSEEIEISIPLRSLLKREADLKFVTLQDLDFVHNLAYAWNETKYYLRANFIGIAELISR